jgi:putative adenylate-forming enzyme
VSGARERGADVATALRRSRALLARDRWSAERLRAHQHAALTALVRDARARSPFYRELYAGLGPAEPVALHRLPAVDKATLMERFDEVVTDPRLRLAELEAHLDGLAGDALHLGRYRVTASGGSTGRRGVVVTDRDEWRAYLAGLLRINHTMGLRPRLPRPRVATIAAARPAHVTYRMSRSLDVGLFRLLRLDATTPVEQLVEPLNRHRPEFLYSYPSVLELLAAAQIEGRLRIAPSVIVSSGETHTPEMERVVRAAFDVPWFQLYAATEAPILGAHCPRHTGLHVFEDMVIVEVVDEDDRPVPDGQPGHRVLVTNLVNRTQPLIRYAITDMVTAIPERCPCGRPFRLLAGVEGRSDDILRLPAATGGEVAVHPLALRGPLAAITDLRQYTIRYEHPQVRVSAILRPGAPAPLVRERIATSLRDGLTARGAAPLEIDVALVDRVADARDAAGKLKVVAVAPGPREELADVRR